MKIKKPTVFRYADEEEEQKVSALEDFLFGGSAQSLLAKTHDEQGIAAIVRQAEAAGSDSESDDGDEFVVDRAGADEEEQQQAAASGSEDDEAGPGPGSMRLQEQEAAAGKGSRKRRAPAWVDPADASITVDVAAVPRMRKLRQAKGQTAMAGPEYEAALRRQHCALNPRTAWAAPPSGSTGRRHQQQQRRQQQSGAVGSVNEAEEPDEETAEKLLLSGAGLLLPGGAGGGGGGGLIPPGSLELSRLRDANGTNPSDAVVQALQFHPNGQLMLTAGFDKRLKLFQVDGLRNPLVQSLFLEDCPVHSAAFAAGGDLVVAAGRRPFYYVADLHSGHLERVTAPPSLHLRTAPHSGGAQGGSKGAKRGGGMRSCESFAACSDASRPLVAFLGDGGHIGLVSLRSRTPVGSLKMNGTARAAAFSSDGSTLVTAGGDGVVYTWDLRSQRCLHQLRDEGVVGATSLALSPDGSYLASGDSAGAVNLYRRPAGLLAPLLLDGEAGGAGDSGADGFGLQPDCTPPLKSLMNLTTSIDTLGFSHDSQLLLMGSRLKRDALRLVHMPSLTVFANWPTSKSPLNYVHCAAFSPHSGFLGIGNAKGRALLYRLHHYPQA